MLTIVKIYNHNYKLFFIKKYSLKKLNSVSCYKLKSITKTELTSIACITNAWLFFSFIPYLHGCK